MVDVCPRCGLPKTICVCETITREQQRIRIKTETRKWGRLTTIIEGLNGSREELNEIASNLKTACACGGAVKEGMILLQGDHKEKARDILVSLGFSEDNIEVL